VSLRQIHILGALLSAIHGVPHHAVAIVNDKLVMKPEKKYLTKNQKKAARRKNRK
jgi:hypothetical protein